MQNLSKYQNIQVLHFDDPNKLKDALASILLPFEVINLYGMNGRHYAWIVPSQKVKLVPVKKSFKDDVKNKPKNKR